MEKPIDFSIGSLKRKSLVIPCEIAISNVSWGNMKGGKVMKTLVKGMGGRLWKERIIKGFSRRVLGNLCGVTKNTIFNYENEISEPAAAKLKELAEALEVSSDYLLGLSEN